MMNIGILSIYKMNAKRYLILVSFIFQLAFTLYKKLDLTAENAEIIDDITLKFKQFLCVFCC